MVMNKLVVTLQVERLKNFAFFLANDDATIELIYSNPRTKIQKLT